MKQYIIDALENGDNVVLYFSREKTKTFDQLINKFDSEKELLELGQTLYKTRYLININHVQYVKVQKQKK